MAKNTKEIIRLESNIRFHRYLYYNKDPRITDQEFDALYERLKQIAPDSEVLKETGAPPDKNSGWQEVPHQMRLTSLSNAMTIDEFNKWIASVSALGKVLVLEDKFDGASLEIIYDNGILVQAITRGDGKTGEDITINVKKMKYVKLELKEKISCSVRCEIMLFKNNFNTINSQLTAADDETYSNPRNAANGICKRFDGKYSEYLILIAYDMYSSDVTFSSETEKMDYMADALDLMTANYKLVTAAEVIKLREQYAASLRESLPYFIDGLVIKVNSIQKQKDLGSQPSGDPKGQIAFKFDARGVATKLNNVINTVGRTGVITPNAVIEPVNIDGAMIKAASIHNYDEIARLGLGIGDEIIVIKAGEVIPKIIKVIKSAGNPIKIPVVCPACGGKVEKDGANLKCMNDECEGKEFRKLRHWVDVMKKRMSLEDIGESTIAQLYDKELIKDPADFYKLTLTDISDLERSGDKSARKIVDGFSKCKDVDVVTFLMALAIPALGETMAETITEEYDLYALMEEVTEADLAKISGIGPNRASEILTGLQSRRPLIEKLMELGVKVRKPSAVKLQSNKLSGKSFQVTGPITKINPATGKSYNRDEWYEFVQANGGTISRVNKDLNYLLICRSGSGKIAKAEKFRITMISEDQFWTMIE